MAKAKPQPVSPFAGYWRIVSMSNWDQDFVDEEIEGYVEFGSKNRGEFHFGYVHGFMDCRQTTRDGEPAVEWSWEGNDEMEPVFGRGWAVLKEGDIQGRIFFHLGDESEFTAKKNPRRPKRA